LGKKLVIGIDIDGVIVDLVSMVLPKLSEVCGRPISYQDICCWDLGESLGLDATAVASVWEQAHSDDLLPHAPPVGGAVSGLARLKGHEIWLITARPITTRQGTIAWLDQHRIEYDYLIFDQRHKRHAVGPRFDVFIEDYLEEAVALAEAGIFTLLLDQPWNQAPALPQRCQRIDGWETIIARINELETATE